MPRKRYRSRSRGGYRRRRRYGPSTARIKRQVLSVAESKYKSYDIKGSQFFHDTISRHDLWGPLTDESNSIWPSQGSYDSGRVGDMIYCSGIRIRGLFEVPNDRFNMKMKLFFVQWNSAEGTPSTQAELLHNVSGNILIDPIQNKRWRRIRYLGMIQCRPSDSFADSAQTKTILINKWIPMNQKVYFNADTSETPTNVKEYGSLLFLPYDTISSATTDRVVVGSEITYTVYWKDL